MKIRVKLLEKWGEYKVGDEVMFDERKGRSLIANGTGIEARKSRTQIKAEEKTEAQAKAKTEAEAKAKAKAEAETAMNVPAGETADARPDIKGKPEKAKTK